MAVPIVAVMAAAMGVGRWAQGEVGKKKMRMLRTGLSLAILASAVVGPARAADIKAYVDALPNVITEVDTAGSWSDNGKNGVFRAVLLIVPVNDTSEAHLVIQLLSTDAGGNSWSVYKSLPVQQFNDKKMPTATLYLEEYDTENEITWTVTGNDAKTGEETSSRVRVTVKGVVEVSDVTKAEEGQQKPEEKN